MVRPSLSERALAAHRNSFPRNPSTVLTPRIPHSGMHPEDTHAEAFYFQKQMQAQTRMVIVLEDGEHLEGVLEWYDRNAIKLRNGNRLRVMIYKSSIKYLYKAAEVAPRSIMQ
ncbi:MAG: Hfq-like protein [Acidobacteriaceae bacterium]